MTKTALIIIDMLNDFMTGGALPNKNAKHILPNIKTLLDHSRRSDDWVAVFANDSHMKDDVEMKLWGEHAMKGTNGAKVTDILEPKLSSTEWEEPKSYYSAFEQNPLASRLRSLDVDTLILTGQHTNCCVMHTAYHGFINGFELLVPKDAVVSYNEDPEISLQRLKDLYGAGIFTTNDIISM